jgi:prepilin-type N-terminal cleavage/methylation domain-containing protein
VRAEQASRPSADRLIGRLAAWALKQKAQSVEKTSRPDVFSAMPTFRNRERPEHPGAGRGDSDRGGVRLGREGGFTLIELLVVMAVATVVLGAIMTLLYTSQQVQAGDAEWAQVMQEGRTGLSRMTREIRQASEIKTHEAGTIEFLATVKGTVWKIKYECGVEQPGTAYHECVRKAVEKSTGTLPSTGTPIARDIRNPTEVFKYFKGATQTAEPEKMNVVTLSLSLPASGTLKQTNYKAYEHKTVVLENAAYIRNCNVKEAGKARAC